MKRCVCARTTCLLAGVLTGFAAPAGAARGSFVTNFSGTFSTAGGGLVTATGSGQYDPATRLGSGTVAFDQPQDICPLWLIPIGWLILDSRDACHERSLVDHGNGVLMASMTSDLGTAGTATLSFLINGSTASVTGDFTNVNLSAVKLPGNTFSTFYRELIVGTGPGTASGSASVSVAGSVLSTESNSYSFLGNPSAVFQFPKNNNFEASFTQVDPLTATFSGQSFGSLAVPEPAALTLLGIGALALLVRGKRRQPFAR